MKSVFLCPVPVKTERLLFSSYLAMVENSVGASMFRNFYLKEEKGERDVMENGRISCAFHVSSILALFGLIERFHGTVDATLQDMEKSGWKEEPLRKGSVLLWEKKSFFSEERPRRHLGFFLGDEVAVSNDGLNGCPVKHHFTYYRQRALEGVYWHSLLDG